MLLVCLAKEFNGKGPVATGLGPYARVVRDVLSESIPLADKAHTWPLLETKDKRWKKEEVAILGLRPPFLGLWYGTEEPRRKHRGSVFNKPKCSGR
jgi:hypothetical protein